ncbi:MAG: hypothetical protein K2H21_05320 [Muribaculaceae bacterium]|nr:hypothetical protein [Muribaculaceae bacterium]
MKARENDNITTDFYSAGDSDVMQVVKIAAAVIGMIAVGLVFWHALIWFMWMCFDAGVKM